jgi:hypothetical protein
MKEKRMKQIFRLACLGALLVFGSVACEADRDQARPKSPVAEARSAAQAQEPAELSPPTIPADVTYTVINTEVIPGIKRSLDVRLSRKVEEDVLRSVALNLKRDDPKRYERTFIVYYLPDMEVGAGGWATTHFNPELEVKILGLTAKQEESLATKVEDVAREVVGSWLDQSPMVGGRISIYRKEGMLYMERTFKDGSSSNKELAEKPSSGGKRFEEKGGSRFGEHYIIDEQGNLQIRDQEGLIATAKKIK